MSGSGNRLVDLSHAVEDGLITYRGFPAPVICDYWSREDSERLYADGVSFQIGRIEMVANTGTYVDAPFHRYADGRDLSELRLETLADLRGVVIRADPERRAIDVDAFDNYDLNGKAVLVETGWSRHWRSDRYFEGHPFLTAATAERLRDAGAVLVGIDSYNIDDTSDRARPVHSILLGAGVPIVEHMTNLSSLPDTDFRFHAVPVKIKGMGSFPVRAYGVVRAEG